MLVLESEQSQARIVETPGLQWLVLAGEGAARYTNWGDEREGDASVLVTKVNADPVLGAGLADWRLPTLDELESLICNEAAPKQGVFWTSSAYEGNSRFAWVFCFPRGLGCIGGRYILSQVRLVRAVQ